MARRKDKFNKEEMEFLVPLEIKDENGNLTGCSINTEKIIRHNWVKENYDKFSQVIDYAVHIEKAAKKCQNKRYKDNGKAMKKSAEKIALGLRDILETSGVCNITLLCLIMKELKEFYEE